MKTANDNINLDNLPGLEDMQKEFKVDNFGFTRAILYDLCGIGYDEIFDIRDRELILKSAKSTKKTHNMIALVLGEFLNIPNANIIIIRTNISTHAQSTYKEIQNVIDNLINNYGLIELSIFLDRKNLSSQNNLTNMRLQHPDGREIRFISAENKQKINGSGFSKGGVFSVYFDEPIESLEEGKKFTKDLITEKEGDTATNSLLRGPKFKMIYEKYPNALFKFKDNKGNIKLGEFKRRKYFTLNPGDDTKGISKKANKINPGTQEGEDAIKQNRHKNFLNIKSDGKTAVVLMTAFINEFKDRQREEEEEEEFKLINIDPLIATTLIGKPYDGTSPDIFIGREHMQKQNDYAIKYLEDNYHNIKKIVIGCDIGKNDANVLCEGVLIKENSGEPLYTLVVIGGYYLKNPKNKKDKMDYETIREKLEDGIYNYNIELQEITKTNAPILFSYDDHGGETPEQVGKNLNIKSITSPKTKIVYRIFNNKQLLAEAKVLVIGEGLPEEFGKEFGEQEYATQDMNIKTRDEKHFKVDAQNAFEYMLEPIRNRIKQGVKQIDNTGNYY